MSGAVRPMCRTSRHFGSALRHGSGPKTAPSHPGELTVSKLNFAAMSLIAAIPGGYLLFRMLKAIPHFGEMVGMMRIVYGLILVLTAVVTVIPVGILIFVKEDKQPKSRDEETEAEAVADEVDDIPATEDHAGRQSVVMEETATKVEMSDEFFDDMAEAEEEPKSAAKGKKKKEKKKKK